MYVCMYVGMYVGMCVFILEGALAYKVKGNFGNHTLFFFGTDRQTA